MSQITLRKLPDHLERQIRHIARDNNMSINKTIIMLLTQSLGLSEEMKKQRSLDDLAGNWDQDEVREFEANTELFSRIDSEIW